MICKARNLDTWVAESKAYCTYSHLSYIDIVKQSVQGRVDHRLAVSPMDAALEGSPAVIEDDGLQVDPTSLSPKLRTPDLQGCDRLSFHRPEENGHVEDAAGKSRHDCLPKKTRVHGSRQTALWLLIFVSLIVIGAVVGGVVGSTVGKEQRASAAAANNTRSVK
jgi:hypothetical protein